MNKGKDRGRSSGVNAEVVIDDKQLRISNLKTQWETRKWCVAQIHESRIVSLYT